MNVHSKRMVHYAIGILRKINAKFYLDAHPYLFAKMFNGAVI